MADKKKIAKRLHIICGMCGCDTMLLYTTHQESEETKVSIICKNCASLTELDEVIPNDTEKPLQS